MKLSEYIKEFYGGNNAAFARSQCSENRTVSRQNVRAWVKAGHIVINGSMYSLRRELKEVKSD